MSNSESRETKKGSAHKGCSEHGSAPQGAAPTATAGITEAAKPHAPDNKHQHGSGCCGGRKADR
jgi:hypothetical protein